MHITTCDKIQHGGGHQLESLLINGMRYQVVQYII